MVSCLRSLSACALVASLLLVGSNAQAADEVTEQLLTKGGRIVFLGDSITQAGAGASGYVTLVREALNKSHGELGIEVIGAGISGNKVPDLERRLEKDVLTKNPSVVVIYIGINDVWHSQSGRGTPKEEFEAGLGRLIDKIQTAGSKVVLSTASVIGEKTDGSNALDKMLAEYCDISKKVAAEKKVKLLDLNGAFWAYLKKNNPENKEQGILTSDKVHLNAAGNKFVAAQMLTALGAGSEGEKVLRHVVLFKFKEGTSKEKIDEITAAFAELPKKIPAIVDFEYGTDNSPEGLSDGFNHIWIVTFKDEKGRDEYLPHEAHQEFVKLLKPHLEQPLVVDFWGTK